MAAFGEEFLYRRVLQQTPAWHGEKARHSYRSYISFICVKPYPHLYIRCIRPRDTWLVGVASHHADVVFSGVMGFTVPVFCGHGYLSMPSVI
jgi:hypothetical protein